MASLDIHTLIVITAVVTLLTAFLLATFANVVPSGIKGHKLWIASFLIYSVSTGLAMAENAQFPQLARYASSVLEVIAGCVLYAGVCQFFARPIPRALIAGCILFELGILTGSLLSADGGQLRWMALIFARGLLPLGIAWVAWTARTRDRWISGVNLGALAAFSQFIVVLLYAATESSPRLAAVLGFTQTLFISTEMALAIIGAVAMIHVVNDRIRDDLEYLASHDMLTGVLSRRSFDEQYARELARAARSGHYPALLMVDIDNFKSINDAFGHAVGDRSLRAVCATMARMLRQEDFLGRYGGEEFVILLPATDADTACDVAERIRRSIEMLDLGEDESPLYCTVSIGVASCMPGVPSKVTTRLADEAMYRAKRQGKNRTVLADPV